MLGNYRRSRSESSKDDAFINDWNPEFPSAARCDESPSENGLNVHLAPPSDLAILDETLERVSKEQIDPNLEYSFNSRFRDISHTQMNPRINDDKTAVKSSTAQAMVFPKLGEAIGGFRLISELGRGAFARVYLAREAGLGNRHVALKVSKAEGEEPQILARLQHTHIVPIHSLYDDDTTGLRLICMPYFGGANLAQLLEATGEHRGGQTHGKSLVNALDMIGQPVIVSVPKREPSLGLSVDMTIGSVEGRSVVFGTSATLGESPQQRSLLSRLPWWTRTPSQPDAGISAEATEFESQPARAFINVASYVRASVWIMARLAEGLEHAHSRNLLHRDLKPSNILMAADGTPMLLDFNLATESEGDAAENGEKARLGGTLPYMSPEHLDAFNPNGSTQAQDVGVRSDIYALGLILFEMVAGRHPFPPPPDGMKLLDVLTHMTTERRGKAPSLRKANPETPWSLDAIVAKCIDPDSVKRYRSAGELAEELRRFLDNQPLKYTTEPSVRETMKKWSRRHPRASSASTIVLVATAVIALGCGAYMAQAHRLELVAARLNLRKFHDVFQECQFLLNTSSAGDLTGHLKLGVKKADAAISRYGFATTTDWDRSFWAATLSRDERTALRQNLLELIVLDARAKVALAAREGSEDDRRRTLEWAVATLDRAETCEATPSAAILSDRARYHNALGQADLARRDNELAAKLPSVTCRDEYLLGTADLAMGRFDSAEARLNHAVSLDPSRFWAWFALGLCHYDQGRFNDAVGDFNVCTVQMAKFAWPFANRGQALARSGRLAESRDAFSKALDLNSDFLDAMVGRGLVYLELGQAAEAEFDLLKAKSLGKLDPIAEAGLAEALAKQGKKVESLAIYDQLINKNSVDARLFSARGMMRVESDPTAAAIDFEAAMTLDSTRSMPYYGMARLAYRSDLPHALLSVDQAIDREPNLLDAVQLRALIRARLGRADALLDVETLLQKPTGNRLYNSACVLAILAKKHPEATYAGQSLRLLKRAIEAGIPSRLARDDMDFAHLADKADFRQLVGERH